MVRPTTRTQRIDRLNQLQREYHTLYKDEYITDDIEEQQKAKRAKGITAPQQPTQEERIEHELTHLAYRI